MNAGVLRWTPCAVLQRQALPRQAVGGLPEDRAAATRAQAREPTAPGWRGLAAPSLAFGLGLARAQRQRLSRQTARYSTGPEAPTRALGPVFSTQLHRLAREALLERFRQISDKGVLLFSGGPEMTRHDTDHEDLFRQESTFHYLFGVREPGYMGTLDLESGSATLFAPRLPAEYELWMGKIADVDTLQEHYGVDEVVYVDEIAAWFQRRAPTKVYIQRGRNSDSGSEVAPASFDGLSNYDVDEELLHPVVYETRARKNEEELRLLRYVNRISADAHIGMMRQARPGLMEYQLESTFAYSCHYNGGCRLLSYTPIAGSGPNSAVLHYGHAGAPNDRRLEDGDIVLCDMGCEYYCYASDITNSFPATGTFSKDQRLIFETVAAMQFAVLSSMKPGVAWVDMHELAYRVMCEKLTAAGLLVGDVDEMMAANVGGVLMPHGLGHFLGIDTHDVGGYPEGAQRDTRDGFKSLRCQRVLEPGFVLTVEPGVYFVDYSLRKAKEDPELSKFFNWDHIAEFENFGGIRLEDNVLVTDDGIENFTVAPRTVEEVEAVMRGEIADAAALMAWRHEQEEQVTEQEEEYAA